MVSESPPYQCLSDSSSFSFRSSFLILCMYIFFAHGHEAYRGQGWIADVFLNVHSIFLRHVLSDPEAHQSD